MLIFAKIMKNEKGRRNRPSRDDKKGPGKKKSGWVKPDGTPLRKRKGTYFPDAEIEKRKPALLKRAGSSEREEKPAKTFTRDRGTSPEQAPFEREPARKGSFKAFRSGRRDEKPGGDRERAYGKKSRDNSERRFDKKPENTDERKFERSTRVKEESETRTKSRESGERSFEKKPRENGERGYEKKPRGSSPYKSRGDNSQREKGPWKRDERRSSAPSRSRFKADSVNSDSKPVRLNKFIANAGICSRREADDLITAGVISINGNVVTELGTKVMPGDEVKFHDQSLKTEKLVYVLLNKPKDFITTTDDPSERKTVMNLVHDAGKERIFPVGRLDRNTTGLLLITNDGELTKRLTHPSGNIKKIYQVELDRNLSQDDMIRAAEGVELEDGMAHVDEIHYESPTEKNIVGVELHSGRNRVVRRIFEAMDYKVKKLDRVYFAGLTKKDLPRGRWRYLTEMEVNMLKMLTGKKR
jgi:23S rRNA pseudouridine2605 synthase